MHEFAVYVWRHLKLLPHLASEIGFSCAWMHLNPCGTAAVIGAKNVSFLFHLTNNWLDAQWLLARVSDFSVWGTYTKLCGEGRVEIGFNSFFNHLYKGQLQVWTEDYFSISVTPFFYQGTNFSGWKFSMEACLILWYVPFKSFCRLRVRWEHQD